MEQPTRLELAIAPQKIPAGSLGDPAPPLIQKMPGTPGILGGGSEFALDQSIKKSPHPDG